MVSLTFDDILVQNKVLLAQNLAVIDFISNYYASVYFINPLPPAITREGNFVRAMLKCCFLATAA